MKKRTASIIILFLTVSLHLFGQPKKESIKNGISFIVNKFNKYDLVAIGETHDKREVTDFYIELVSNLEFRKKVDFIVIEMGNHLYQNVLNDYISGKEVDEKDIYKLWRDHTSCMLNESDNTGMIRLLEAIRTINKSSEHRIRVLAADPNIDWKKIKCVEDFYKFLGQRDEYYAEVVRKYIVDKEKKGFLIMGNSHFNFQRTKHMLENNLHNPITSIIDRAKAKLYLLNIMSSSSFPYEKLNGIEKGSIVLTSDSWLGELKISSPFIKDKTLKSQTNGIVFLGNKTDLSSEITTDFNDAQYIKELERRKNLSKCN